MIQRCNKHIQCLRGFVQTPDDVSILLNCMVVRKALRVSGGKFRRRNAKEDRTANKS